MVRPASDPALGVELLEGDAAELAEADGEAAGLTGALE